MIRVPSWLAQGIPFYLISAACMLGGCLAINNSLSWETTPAVREIILIAQLNVYEMALIALAWFLVRRGQVRDGVMLAGIEAFFLVDVSFLNAQMATGSFGLGLAVNFVLFAAALAKVGVLARIAGLSLRDGKLAAITLQLLALFAIPLIFRKLDGGDLAAGVFYAGWWAAGLLIPASFAIARFRDRTATPPALNGIVRLLCVLPWVSILLHLGMLHWVYQSTFYAAEAAPVLLGLACALYHIEPFRRVTRRDLTTMQFTLTTIAVLISLTNPAALNFAFGKQGRFTMTPVDLALAGAYLTFIYCFARRYAMRLVTVGAGCAMAVVFGPTVQDIENLVSRVWGAGCRTAWALVPKTAAQAGIAAIVAAFGFLGIGAAVSFRRKAPEASSDMGA